MRFVLFAALVAAGLGLIGSSGASAAPIDGAALRNAVAATDSVQQAMIMRKSKARTCHDRRRSRLIRC